MILWLAIIVIAAFIGFGIFLYFAQTRMVFFPTRELAVNPGDFNIPFEDVTVTSANGKQVHGWYLPPRTSPDSAPVVLFCHGNAGNISHRLETAAYIQELGAGILLFDYQGYGRSEGSPGESETYDDAAAFYQWLRDTKSISADRIVAFGRSLGGAIAIELATEKTVRGLIVESSFTSAEAMAKKMFPFFPVQVLVRYKFASLEKIPHVGCPVLVTHSPEDDLVPYEMGRKLYEAAGPPKKFVELTGGHNTREYFDFPEYRAALEDILGGEAQNWR